MNVSRFIKKVDEKKREILKQSKLNNAELHMFMAGMNSAMEAIEEGGGDKIDIDDAEAFRILCRTLHMDFVLDEETDYFVRNDENGVPTVYVLNNGHDERFDDRGNLFVALRNVAVNISPNLLFRSADYII